MTHLVKAISIAVLSFSVVAFSEDRTEESFIPNFAIGGSYFTWTGDADFSDAAGSVSQYEYGAEVNVPVIMRDTFRLTAGVQYRFNEFDFAGAPFPLGANTSNSIALISPSTSGRILIASGRCGFGSSRVGIPISRE